MQLRCLLPWSHSLLFEFLCVSSAKTLFPNKATGTGDEDLDMVFQAGHNTTPNSFPTGVVWLEHPR